MKNRRGTSSSGGAEVRKGSQRKEDSPWYLRILLRGWDSMGVLGRPPPSLSWLLTESSGLPQAACVFGTVAIPLFLKFLASFQTTRLSP